MDASSDLHCCPTDVTSKVGKAGFQVPGDARSVFHLYMSSKPTSTFSALHVLQWVTVRGINRIIDCRVIAKRVCILVHKDFVDFAKRQLPRPHLALRPAIIVGDNRKHHEAQYGELWVEPDFSGPTDICTR
jgi:hypothetical protein